ncbi:tetratricopeptide (TPR) repeat protein [Symbiobacterium terraclitae]|uniref:Tetratricopeptide (TPR) repeat protein n=1 Tax=Symbiobacterium terraclitae TaxID=557451 RepID=A0ABS4JUX7_9FIRM|nr:hypothetical protein [Symbiobacterium terraclitae]MBP2019346.1 tetratricopeptide (TPR) repeat protein [Symbiobacterium terraclitae]
MSLARLRQLFDSGAYLQARREAERLLPGDLTAAERGEVLCLAGRAALLLGDLYAAVRLTEQAAVAAAAAGDAATESSARLSLGEACLRIGEARRAADHLSTYLARRPEEMAAHDGDAHWFLAMAHQQLRDYAAAIGHFEEAAASFTARRRSHDRARALLGIARCYLGVGAPDLAEPPLAAVNEYLRENPSDTLAAELLCARALQAHLEGDLAGSARLCQEVFVPGRPGVTPGHIGEAAWVMGENALEIGRLEEAHLFAEWAMDHAMQANSPGLINRILDLQRRIRTRRQDDG